MIPLVQVVVDNLHLFLRVAYTELIFFIAELRHHDATDKVHKLHNLDRSKQTHLAVFEILLKEMGVSGYTSWVGKESKKWKWRTPTHPSCLSQLKNC